MEEQFFETQLKVLLEQLHPTPTASSAYSLVSPGSLPAPAAQSKVARTSKRHTEPALQLSALSAAARSGVRHTETKASAGPEPIALNVISPSAGTASPPAVGPPGPGSADTAAAPDSEEEHTGGEQQSLQTGLQHLSKHDREELKKAGEELYRGIHLLKNYRILNYTGQCFFLCCDLNSTLW